MSKKLPSSIWLRFKTLDKVIRELFIISIASIILIELVRAYLKIPIAFDVYLKLCYSFVSATIFYFLNQHLPKEKKKLRSFTYINNKIHLILTEVNNILLTLNIDIEKKITEEQFEFICERVNTNQAVYSKKDSIQPFHNWHEFLNFKTERIGGAIKDLMLIQDIIDKDLLEQLLAMENTLDTYFRRFNKILIHNDTLAFWSGGIYDLKTQSSRAYKIMVDKYWKYNPEHTVRSIEARQAEMARSTW